MKNITVSVDDETYRRARIKAAERDTSVSRMVREFLSRVAGEESQFERLARQERELRERIENFSASDRLSREELHERSLGRQRR
jgi:plasmid stability protein